MSWTRSEPTWDPETRAPDARDNDNARQARSFYGSYFGLGNGAGGDKNSSHQTTGTKFSVYDDGWLDD